MSKVSIIDPCQNSEWDYFIENHPQGWICHLSGWRRVLEQSFHHMKGHFLVIRNKDSIRAGLPVYEVNSWITGKRLVSIPFATLCHPLVSSEEEQKELFDTVIELAKSFKSDYVEIRTMGPLGLIKDDRLSVSTQFQHHYLNLELNPEELKKGFDRTCVRQRINRAIKSNLHLSTVVDETGVKEFFRLYLMTRKRLGLPPQPYAFIWLLWAVFSPARQVEIQLALHEGRAIAGILLLRFRNRVSAEFMVSDETYRNLSPNHLLFWEAIRQAHREGYGIFDFGRTAEGNTSLMDFKKRWGTTVTNLPVYYFPKSRAAQNKTDKSRAYQALNALCRRVPDRFLIKMGDFCYQHLG